MKFALDTNTLVYFFKGMGGVAEKLLSTPRTAIGLPAIVIYEIENGIARLSEPEKRRAQFEQFVDSVTLLPFDRRAASHAADIRTHLESLGQPIGPMDTLIAGTARAHGATLVSRNTREFSRVPGLEIEDWY